jgi:hypothetical protein
MAAVQEVKCILVELDISKSERKITKTNHHPNSSQHFLHLKRCIASEVNLWLFKFETVGSMSYLVVLLANSHNYHVMHV